ncbi:MAG TPA: response regulator [Polyangiaceae bacterium]
MSRLLLVDDDADILEALAGALEDRHQISTAKNGAQALELLKTRPFDAMVLDLMMPVMDGATVISTMRDAGIELSVVLASGNLEVGELALRFGVDHVIKPYDIAVLEGKLARIIGENGKPNR